MALEAVQTESHNPPQATEAPAENQVAFLCIPPQSVEKVWDKVGEFIESSFSKRAPAYTLDDVKKNLLTNECQLWVAVGMGRIMAAAITMITVEPLVKTLAVIHMGGENMRLWIHELDVALTAFARENGCGFAEAITRRGLEKFVPGWEPEGIVYIKKIEP